VTITGNWGMHRGDFEENLSLVVNGTVKLGRIITHCFRLDDIEAAFDRVLDREKERVGKVVINP